MMDVPCSCPCLLDRARPPPGRAPAPWQPALPGRPPQQHPGPHPQGNTPRDHSQSQRPEIVRVCTCECLFCMTDLLHLLPSPPTSPTGPPTSPCVPPRNSRPTTCSCAWATPMPLARTLPSRRPSPTTCATSSRRPSSRPSTSSPSPAPSSRRRRCVRALLRAAGDLVGVN